MLKHDLTIECSKRAKLLNLLQKSNQKQVLENFKKNENSFNSCLACQWCTDYSSLMNDMDGIRVFEIYLKQFSDSDLIYLYF